MDIPESPAMPLVEGEVPETTIPASLGAELDLDDSGDEVMQETIKEDANDDDEMINPLASHISREAAYETPMLDFSDNVKPPVAGVNPFGESNMLQSCEAIPLRLEGKIEPLSDVQEQKLLEYIDEKQLEMQRGFVKYLGGSGVEDGGLGWLEVCHLAGELVEFVWYGLTLVKGGVPVVYHVGELNVDDSLARPKAVTIVGKEKQGVPTAPGTIVFTEELLLPMGVSSRRGLFSAVVRLLGDLVDYVVKYRLVSGDDWRVCLQLLARMDNLVCVLVDYGGVVSVTDAVRVGSLVHRMKMVLVALLEEYGGGLQHGEELLKLQSAVGEVFVGTIERVC